jgi:hypothetical protein
MALSRKCNAGWPGACNFVSFDARIGFEKSLNQSAMNRSSTGLMEILEGKRRLLKGLVFCLRLSSSPQVKLSFHLQSLLIQTSCQNNYCRGAHITAHSELKSICGCELHSLTSSSTFNANSTELVCRALSTSRDRMENYDSCLTQFDEPLTLRDESIDEKIYDHIIE